MRLLDILRLRLRALTRSSAADRDLDEELQLHLDRLVEEKVAAGMPPHEARDAARREFGPVTQLTEASRDARGVMWIVNGWQDMRYGMRLMARAPGFAAAVILTVALGIGATTAMFSVVYSVVLQPLPYREPRSAGEPVEHRAQARPAARLRRQRQRRRLAGAQSRVRGHRGAARGRQLQPDRPGRAGAAVRLPRLGQSVSDSRRDAVDRPHVHARRGSALRGRRSTSRS